MKISRWQAILLAGLLTPLAVTQAQEALRPAVGKPLTKAKSLLASHDYAGALQQADLAAHVKDKTPAEDLVILEMRGAIQQSAGDQAGAAKTYQQLADSGRVTGPELQKFLSAEASLAFAVHDYGQTIAAIVQYQKSGGSDPALQALLIQAHYQQKEYGEAARLQAAQIQDEERAGKRPPEAALQLLAAAQQQGGDAAGLHATMQTLVLYYPSPAYWASLIGSLEQRSGFSERLALDVRRLQRAVQSLDTADGYTELAELALAAGLPGEAKSVLEEGYARHLLGTGPAAARQDRLRALAERSLADDRRRLDRSDSVAGDADANRVEELGEQYLSLGEIDKGSALIEQSLRKGQLRHADDAKLHLGLAYLKADQPEKAVQILQTINGTDGTADLAQMWIIHTKKT
jgi:hypothetical protein